MIMSGTAVQLTAETLFKVGFNKTQTVLRLWHTTVIFLKEVSIDTAVFPFKIEMKVLNCNGKPVGFRQHYSNTAFIFFIYGNTVENVYLEKSIKICYHKKTNEGHTKDTS